MNFWKDMRYGVRMLVKSPAFTGAAIITLALGIGATTATFSCADALLWKPIPLPDLDSLVIIGQRADNPGDFNSATPADIADLRQQSTTLTGMADWQEGLANIAAAGGEPDRESITIDAGVEHMPARGQARRKAVRVGKELARGDDAAVPQQPAHPPQRMARRP